MTNDTNSVKNAHDIDLKICVCRQCGCGLEELEETSSVECTGTRGVTHIQFARWRREASLVFGPITNALFGRWQ